MTKKIVVIGGGSQYALGLVESFIDYADEDLKDTEIVLLDVVKDHLLIVHRYAEELKKSLDVNIKFTATTDRRKAFKDADFLLTTFRPGTHEQQLQDEEIPPKYGLQGNETIGIGGIFMNCRVMPVLQEICSDAEKLCPNAWIINYTNPTQYVADGIRRISNLKVVSLCDGYLYVNKDLALLLECDPLDIQVYPFGTNHATWIKSFTVNGQDGYPLLEARLRETTDEEIEEIYKPSSEVEFDGMIFPFSEIYKQFAPRYCFPFSLKLYRIFGLLPTTRYYWKYHLDQDNIIDLQQRGEHVSMAGFYLKHTVPLAFENLDKRHTIAIEKFRFNKTKREKTHGDLAVRVIASIIGDRGETFVVNVPNEGSISNLPKNAIVEIPAIVNQTGIHPFAMGPLPKSLLGYQYSLILSQELAVSAAMSGNKNDLLKAIIAHPLIQSVDAAEKAMNRLLSLQAEWLPQFNKSEYSAVE